MIRFIFLTLLMLSFFSAVNAQLSKKCYYMGYLYSENADGTQVRRPFVPVTLALEDNLDEVIAVRMSDSQGMVSFKDVPVDVKKNHIITLMVDGKQLMFRREGTDNTKLKGNISIHTSIPSEIEYLQKKELVPSEGGENMGLMLWLSGTNCGVSVSGNELINTETQLPMRLFVIGR